MPSCHLLTLARNVANDIPCTSRQHNLVDCGGNHYYQATKSHWLCLCTAYTCTNGHIPCMIDFAVLDSCMGRLIEVEVRRCTKGPLMFTPIMIHHGYLRYLAVRDAIHRLPVGPVEVHNVEDAAIHQYRRGDYGMNVFTACTSCSACSGIMACILIGCKDI